MSKKTSDELFRHAEDVKKYLHKDEMYFLYETVFHMPDNSIILEIGSFKGGSAVIMGMAIRDSKKISQIFAVDPFLGSSEYGSDVDTSSEFDAAINNHNVAQYITIISKASEIAFDEWEFGRRIDFLWVDGGHEYEFVSKDIQLWNSYLNVGGKIALHDSEGIFMFGLFTGVRRAIKEYMFEHKHFKDYGFVHSITYATKTHTMTVKEWAKTRKAYYCWWIGRNDLNTKKYASIILPAMIIKCYIYQFIRFVKYFIRS